MGHALCSKYLPSASSANPMTPPLLGTILSFLRAKDNATLCPLQASSSAPPTYLGPASRSALQEGPSWTLLIHPPPQHVLATHDLPRIHSTFYFLLPFFIFIVLLLRKMMIGLLNSVSAYLFHQCSTPLVDRAPKPGFIWLPLKSPNSRDGKGHHSGQSKFRNTTFDQTHWKTLIGWRPEGRQSLHLEYPAYTRRG